MYYKCSIKSNYKCILNVVKSVLRYIIQSLNTFFIHTLKVCVLQVSKYLVQFKMYFGFRYKKRKRYFNGFFFFLLSLFYLKLNYVI